MKLSVFLCCLSLAVIVTSRSPCRNEQCGRARTSGRVVGGEELSSNDYPWLALLKVKMFYIMEVPFCGGALISQKHVITAAHCAKKASGKFFGGKIYVTLGAFDRCSSEKSQETVAAAKTILHEDYSTDTHMADLAIIVLERQVDAVPICLPAQGMDYAGQVGVLPGWGMTEEESSDQPCKLQQVRLPVMSRDQCGRSRYSSQYTSDVRAFCAGTMEGGHDTCQGDSGGPLQVLNRRTGLYDLVGVVSFAVGCARAEYPGINVNVTYFLDWIEEIKEAYP